MKINKIDIKFILLSDNALKFYVVNRAYCLCLCMEGPL